MWFPIAARKRRCVRALVALALIVCARPGAALVDDALVDERTALDEAPPALRAAVREVWLRNAAVAEAEAKLDAALARARGAARPLYNPELEFAAENADVNTRSIGISQSIDWSGKRRVRAAAADADVRVAQAERDEARQRIALEWLRGFAAFAIANEQAALGGERVRLLDGFASLAARRFRAGDIAVLERDLAELAGHEARAQQARLVTDVAKARQLLVAIGGRSESLPPMPNGLPPATDASASPERLAALPALRRAAAQAESAQARVSVAERDRKPDPTVSLSGGRVTSGPISDRLVGVTLKIPLFVRNDYRAAADAARAEADAADAAQRDLLVRARAQDEQAVASYSALREAWLAWKDSRVPSASDRAVLLQRLWEAGEISTADYLVQLKQSLDTELTAADLRAGVWQAFADWLAASGGLERWLGVADDASVPTSLHNPETVR